MIDQEVQRIITEQYERAKKILSDHAEGHNKLAQVLLEREVIYTEDVEHIFGKRAWISRSQEILDLQEKAKKKKKIKKKKARTVSLRKNCPVSFYLDLFFIFARKINQQTNKTTYGFEKSDKTGTYRYNLRCSAGWSNLLPPDLFSCSFQSDHRIDIMGVLSFGKAL